MKKNTNHQFLIGSWISFYPFEINDYEYQLDQLQKAGLNFNIFPYIYGDAMDTPEVCDRVEQAYASRNMLYLMNGGLDEDTMNRAIQLAQGKTNCIGYYLKDEPQGKDLPEIGRIARAYSAADKTRYPFVNLFPSYAGEEALDGSYYDHCSRYVREVGAEHIEYLSHDFYPFQKDLTTLGIFEDMDVIRRVALENSRLRTHAFPQACSWDGYRMPNIHEMRWNAYAYLAYGFKALSWFNLVCFALGSDPEGEKTSDGIIYRDGLIPNPQLLEEFGDLNREILTLGDTLIHLDAVHVYHTQKDLRGVEHLPADWMITPMGNKNWIISHLTTRTGDQTYVMLFNMDRENEVTASFKISAFSGIEDLEYISPFDGSFNAVIEEDGVFTDTFRPGEGKLYKLNGKISYRTFSFDPAHPRADVDLAAARPLVGVDLTAPYVTDVSVQISTNKRFTEDKTVTHRFDEIPADGRLRFEATVGKYVRVIFGVEQTPELLSLIDVRVRYADEPMDELAEELSIEPEEIIAGDEEPAEIVEVIEETEEPAETVEVIEETEPAEIVEVIEETEEPAETVEVIEETEELAEAVEVIEETEEPAETVEVIEETEEPAETVEVIEETEETAPAEAPLFPDVDYSDLNEALAVVDGLVKAEYSAESWSAVEAYYPIAQSMKDGTHPQEEVTAAYWQLLDLVRELVPIQWTLPKPEIPAPEKHPEKANIHVAGGILTTAVASLAGSVAGLFAFKKKKRK